MEIRFFATLRPLVGGKAVSVPVAGGEPIGAVLRRLEALYPALQGEVLNRDGTALMPHVQVYIGGRSVRDLQGLETRVQGTESVAVFPPVAGG